ncbi:hypothetical protein HGRIS_011710 [Hohenbuehelia grisea]|uniref:Uncharacterized protein n=1 Tax=Hohenbuehelia grisea TaxID=104357 RepID=A0ABR3JY48_9AGAR
MYKLTSAFFALALAQSIAAASLYARGGAEEHHCPIGAGVVDPQCTSIYQACPKARCNLPGQSFANGITCPGDTHCCSAQVGVQCTPSGDLCPILN